MWWCLCFQGVDTKATNDIFGIHLIKEKGFSSYKSISFGFKIKTIFEKVLPVIELKTQIFSRCFKVCLFE